MVRWTGIKYTLQNNRHLYLLSACRACQSKCKKTLITSSSTYSQQYFMLKDLGIQEPNPRSQLGIKIVQFIHSLNLKQSNMLVLMMDANEQMGTVKLG